MFKKIFVLGFLIVLLLGAIGLWGAYRAYRNNQAERIARLQQKAEEVTITTIEGWTVDETAEYLEKQGMFPKADFISALNKFDESEFPLLVRPENRDLEGYLFPDTYRFAKDATPDEVITKMLANFSSRLGSIGITADDAQNKKFNGLTLYEIITLASIIEQESGGQGSTTGDLSLQDERNLVASVFYNRMEIGQALESDATINYITGKNSPGVSAEDLEVNSAYNTYKHAGLPPGPIGNPSLGSIKAAIAPAESDYLYFLHKQPSGEVDFSRTFEEHKSKK
jgi:UPF0755 protein